MAAALASRILKLPNLSSAQQGAGSNWAISAPVAEVDFALQYSDEQLAGLIKIKFPDTTAAANQGWIRDLTRECVEPNPGPATWVEIYKKALEYSGRDEAFWKPVNDYFESLIGGATHDDVTIFLENPAALVDNMKDDRYKRIVQMNLEKATKFLLKEENAPPAAANQDVQAKLDQMNSKLEQIHNDLHRPARLWDRVRGNPSSKDSSSGKGKSNFRSRVIEYYQRRFNSIDLCMLTNQICNRSNSKAAHFWPKCERYSSELHKCGLKSSDVDSPLNGVLLLGTIEKQVDLNRCCFLYNPLTQKVLFTVVDPTVLDEEVYPGVKFSDINNSPLHHPADRIPSLRMMSIHAHETVLWVEGELGAENSLLPLEKFQIYQNLSPKRTISNENGEMIGIPFEGVEYTPIGKKVLAQYPEDSKYYGGTVQRVELRDGEIQFKIKWHNYKGSQWTKASDIKYV